MRSRREGSLGGKHPDVMCDVAAPEEIDQRCLEA